MEKELRNGEILNELEEKEIERDREKKKWALVQLLVKSSLKLSIKGQANLCLLLLQWKYTENTKTITTTTKKYHPQATIKSVSVKHTKNHKIQQLDRISRYWFCLFHNY